MKGKGHSLEAAPDEELSDGGYSSIEEFYEKETLPQKHRVKRNRLENHILTYLNTQIKYLHIIQQKIHL